MLSIENGRSCLYQWDIGQRLLVENAEVVEVHFVNAESDVALVCEVYEEGGLRVADVPNILLQRPLTIRAYGCCGECVRAEASIPVIRRERPADYVYTETEVRTLRYLVTQVGELSEKVNASYQPRPATGWSIHNHNGDLYCLNAGATTPIPQSLGNDPFSFGAANVPTGRMTYRDCVTDLLFQRYSWTFYILPDVPHSVDTFAFGTRDGNGEATGGCKCVVNPADKTIKLYSSDWAGNDALKRNRTFDFDMVVGEIYVAEIEKCGTHQTTFRLRCTTDATKSWEYVHTATDSMMANKLRCWGGVAFQNIGTKSYYRLLEMAQQAQCDPEYDLLVIGDSFVECGTSLMEASKGYAYLLREKMGRRCMGSGHGGATTNQLIKRMTTDAAIGCYRYAFLQIGSNDSIAITVDKFKENLSEIIAFVVAKGAEPILTTIPVRTDTDNTAFVEEANAWIKSLGYKYVDEHAIISGDHVLSDGIHPNERGHALIYLALSGLIPECF